jgi:hypothetical protein
MRLFEIITGWEEIQGKQFPVINQHGGFAKSHELVDEILDIAGWGTDVDFATVEMVSTDEYNEEDAEEAELLGKEDYGFIDADTDNLPPVHLNPVPGETWIWVLGDRLHLC